MIEKEMFENLTEEEFKIIKAAAEQGDADYHLGNCYYLGEEVEEDYEEAVKWYTKAAEQGHAAAQLMTGYLYYYGHGVAKDYEEAVKWWTAASEQGDVRSQVMLAICYYLGRGVKLDYQEARHWYRLAGVQDSDLAAQCCREEFEQIFEKIKKAAK